MVWLFETSIHDLLASIDKMMDYDFVLYDLGIMMSDISEEKAKLFPSGASLDAGYSGRADDNYSAAA